MEKISKPENIAEQHLKDLDNFTVAIMLDLGLAGPSLRQEETDLNLHDASLGILKIALNIIKDESLITAAKAIHEEVEANINSPESISPGIIRENIATLREFLQRNY